MGQKVTIGTQQFFLDFMVISLERKGYDALLGRGWLIMAKADHNWKKNTLSIESEGKKYIIDIRNQVVSQEVASDSRSETGEDGEMEPNEEGVLRLGNCSEDETSSINGLFHWQMEDYEIFHPECNGLEILEIEEDNTYPPQFAEYQEGEARVDGAPTHQFGETVATNMLGYDLIECGTKEDEDGSKSQKLGTWVQKENWKNKEKKKKRERK